MPKRLESNDTNKKQVAELKVAEFRMLRFLLRMMRMDRETAQVRQLEDKVKEARMKGFRCAEERLRVYH